MAVWVALVPGSREGLLVAVFWTVSIGLKRLDRAGIAGYIARVLSIKLLSSCLHGFRNLRFVTEEDQGNEGSLY